MISARGHSFTRNGSRTVTSAVCCPSTRGYHPDVNHTVSGGEASWGRCTPPSPPGRRLDSPSRAQCNICGDLLILVPLPPTAKPSTSGRHSLGCARERRWDWDRNPHRPAHTPILHGDRHPVSSPSSALPTRYGNSSRITTQAIFGSCIPQFFFLARKVQVFMP